jgi:hypothetical protein
MVTGIVVGMAWVMAGVHVLAWLEASCPSQLEAVCGRPNDSALGLAIGWFAVLIWPVSLALALLCCRCPEAFADED